MQRSSSALLLVAAVLGAILPAMGCADNAEYLTDDRLDNGLVIILPGIEGRSRINENLRRGLVAGGVYRALPIRPWGRPIPLAGPLITQVDFIGNRLAGGRVAKTIIEYQDKHPGRPVYVVGHSGGGGVAVFTAEAMPEDRQIDGLILLSASISSAYDLDKALSRCKRGIVNFYNREDSGVLGLGTILVGTVDGTHGPSAGLIGFDCYDKPGYENLYQVKMMGVSEDTHTTSTQVGFVSIHVTPWILADSWPAGPTDAYLDQPRPPTSGVQVARAPISTTGKAQLKGQADKPVLADARLKGAAGQTHPTVAPRLATDQMLPADGAGQDRNPTVKPAENLGSDKEKPKPAPADPAKKPAAPAKGPQDDRPLTPAGKLPPPIDPEDEADLEPYEPPPAGQPIINPRYRRW